MSRIWFNHWFSTAYYYIKELKDKGHYVIGSNQKENCVYRTISDEFYIEDSIDEDYVEWCKNFVKKHNIDIFFVYRNMVDISAHKNEFDCEVICDDYDKIIYLQSKFNTAAYFLGNKIKGCKLPEYYVVNTVDEFIDAYNKVNAVYGDVCIKYDKDKGGTSYKRIVSRKPRLSRLVENYGLGYDYSYVVDCLKETTRFDDLVVMPYIHGIEISIDCYNTRDGLIAIERRKIDTRETVIQMCKLNVAQEFQNCSKLEYPYNIQLRGNEDEWYLLEVNTRLAGGAYKAEALGVEFANCVVEKSTCPVGDRFARVLKLESFRVRS